MLLSRKQLMNYYPRVTWKYSLVLLVSAQCVYGTYAYSWLCPICYLQHFKCYLHMLTIKDAYCQGSTTTCSAEWLCFSLLNLRMPIYIFLIFSIIIIIFLHLVWKNNPYPWKVWPGIFTSHTKPILFLCQHEGFFLLFLIEIISWFSFS